MAHCPVASPDTGRFIFVPPPTCGVARRNELSYMFTQVSSWGLTRRVSVRPIASFCMSVVGTLCTALANAALTATSDPSVAPSPITPLAPVAVIGNRTLQHEPDIVGDVSVIPRAALQRAAQSSLTEVLNRSRAVEAISYGGPQTVSRLFIRGSNSNQVLVLIDGVRINAATHGGAALNALSAHDIERIEILRGAASSLYGADAVGGVINIVTRKRREDGVSAHATVGAGTHSTQKVDVDVDGGHDGWYYAFGAGYAQSRGFDATTPELFIHNPDRDSYYQRHASAAVTRAWAPDQEISLQINHNRINGGYDAGLPWFNDRTVQSLTGYTLTSKNAIADGWVSTLVAAFTSDRLRTYNAPDHPDAPPGGASQFTNRQRQFTWQNDFKFLKHHQLSVVLERLEQRVRGDLADYSNFPLPPTFVNYPVDKRHTNAVGAIYTGRFARHRFQASIRHDNDSLYGGQTTGALGYAYDITPHLQARLGANTAFRAPDFNERFFPGSGNPNLKPEKARNIEAGLRYTDAVSDVSISVYRNRVHNLIAGFPSVNIGRAVLEGMSLEARRRLGNTHWQAHLDLQKPHDQDTGHLLPLRSRQSFTLLAEHQLAWGLVGVEWEAVGERFGTSDGRERMGGFALTNLTLTYDINPSMQVHVRWNNIFDRNYTLVPGYATAGSNIFAALSVHY